MTTMLRLPSLVCAILLCAAPSFAQGFAFGAKAGVNIANESISGDDPPSLDPRIAPVAGAFVTLPLLPWVGLQVEGLYSMKGAKLDFQGIASTIELDYLEAPVLARIGFARKYYVAAGPSMAFAMRAKARSSYGGAAEEIDVLDQVKRFDFGVAMGGGVEFGSIVIDGRYTLGLTDIDKDTSDGTQTKNRTISLTAGFKF
jgi:hypothetical protein